MPSVLPVGARLPFDLRAHQLASVAAHTLAGTGRSHLVLPPGAGKTAVGVAIALQERRRTLVLVPNTAIQQQWIDLWRSVAPHAPTVSDERDLITDVTVLTYQALATFDPDADDGAPLVEQLHPNASALLARLHDGDPFTLILDEAHHLLHAWGRLIDEVLTLVRGGPAGDPVVVALTATPATRLTAEQAALAQRVFGPVLHEVTTPALVRTGVLAPFRELAWFVTPTDAELDHLRTSARQWDELVTDLLDPALASVGFLEALDRAWVHREPPVPWPRVVRDQPELARALVRLHGHGLLELPDGARITAETREPVAVQDWVALIEEYAVRVLLRPDAPSGDEAAFQAIRRALPAVGWTLTRRGARPGRSPADRVLAHSAAKAQAATELLAAEAAERGDALRAVIITDFERMAATASARLEPQVAPPGSAWEVLAAVTSDTRLGGTPALLITGRSCAGTADALDGLARPDLAREEVPGYPDILQLRGAGWTPRRWVTAATAAFQAGRCPILIGTRGLLGEGWDAAAVNVLIDATSATTPTSVVQIRGRALRRDPLRPDKVSHLHSLVTVADGHPLGDADYRRFVAKHDGFLAPDESGRITAGVGHVSALLEPEHLPDAEARAWLNAATLTQVGRSAEVPALWGVGRPFDDVLVRVAEVVAGGGPRADFDVPEVAQLRPRWSLLGGEAALAGMTGAALASGAGLEALPVAAAAAGAALAVAGGWSWARWRRSRRGRPDDVLSAVGSAVAQALQLPGQVVTAPDGEGRWRVSLDTTDAATADRFARALREVLGPVDNPRYLISRRLPRRRVELWHAVPEECGRNRSRAADFGVAWESHVSRATVLFTGSPEGAGVLAAVQGLSPLDVACGLRTEWR